jgi:hypothetical protein
MWKKEAKWSMEAWKSVGDFAKLLITLNSSILTAILGVLYFGTTNNRNVVSSEVLLLLVCSFVCALICYGRSVDAIRSEVNSKIGIIAANISAILLVSTLIILFFKLAQQ